MRKIAWESSLLFFSFPYNCMKDKFWNDLKTGDLVYYFNSSMEIRASKVSSLIQPFIPEKQYFITTGIQFNNGRYMINIKGKEEKPILKANSCTYVSLSKKILEEKRKQVINSEIKSLESQINKLEEHKNKLQSLL